MSTKAINTCNYGGVDPLIKDYQQEYVVSFLGIERAP